MSASLKTFVPQGKKIICEHKIGGLSASPEPVLHNHDGYEILVFLDGDANFYVEKEGKSLEKGEVLCISPYTFHYAEPLEPAYYERIVLSISKELLTELSTETVDLSACFSVAPAGHINVLHLAEDALQRLIDYTQQLEEILRTSCFADELLTKALLIQILVLLNSPLHRNVLIKYPSIMPLPVKNTVSYIEEHLTENFTIRDLAEELHHNSDYISRCFKKITGITLQNYIIAKRISLAQEYLSKGYPPSEVCYLCGFNNYSNFSRTFTMHLGISPKKYQMSRRPEVL